MTNEERFIASCETVGEAAVRAKLDAGKYSEGKAPWATSWLERIDSGKSEITQEEERSSRLREMSRTQNRLAPAKVVVFIVLLLAVFTALFLLR